ncbi:Rac/Rho-like_protein [Hexamita inflata]|uniref:Rac/Rho-like protein n=1 Tax=Hexamita inflata TaxID=28002 RepID=A0AA86RLN5_9EUKA|nr:Rac/Rho-like protein [Hexamita inflata]
MSCKCVVIGDGAIGKTTLVTLFKTRQFPEYVPTAQDIIIKPITHNSQPIQFELWDTAGAEDYDRLRPLSYPGTDVFLVCYSVNNKTSFQNTVSKWIPEVKRFMPDTPFILVGLKSDLKLENDSVSENEAETVADKFNAHTHIFCSSLIDYNINFLLSTIIEICQNNLSYAIQ